MTDPLPSHSEREQTDESLRLERDKADRALDDEVSEADETADAVISRARARADALLATARAKTDQTSIGDQPTDGLKMSRAIEDHILQRERVTADHVLRSGALRARRSAFSGTSGDRPRLVTRTRAI